VYSNDSANNYLGFWGVRVNGPVLQIPSATTSITNFDDGFDGQILNVLFLGASTTVTHGSNIILIGGERAPAANELVQFLNIAGVWHES
jgi:hypothetical protein